MAGTVPGMGDGIVDVDVDDDDVEAPLSGVPGASSGAVVTPVTAPPVEVEENINPAFQSPISDQLPAQSSMPDFTNPDYMQSAPAPSAPSPTWTAAFKDANGVWVNAQGITFAGTPGTFQVPTSMAASVPGQAQASSAVQVAQAGGSIANLGAKIAQAAATPTPKAPSPGLYLAPSVETQPAGIVAQANSAITRVLSSAGLGAVAPYAPAVLSVAAVGAGVLGFSYFFGEEV